MINVTAIKRIAYIYFVIPFVLFSAGWLNNIAAIIVCSIVILGVVFAWRSLPSTNWVEFNKGDCVLLIAVLGAWLFLSGVGGILFRIGIIIAAAQSLETLSTIHGLSYIILIRAWRYESGCACPELSYLVEKYPQW